MNWEASIMGSARALACHVPRPRGTSVGAETVYGPLNPSSPTLTGEGAGQNRRGSVCSPKQDGSQTMLEL